MTSNKRPIDACTHTSKKRCFPLTHDHTHDTLVCSITQEPIQIAGITSAGSIYEYAAIQSWLKDHNTDPNTGMYLNWKFILRFPFDLEACQSKALQYRTTATYFCPVMFLSGRKGSLHQLLATKQAQFTNQTSIQRIQWDTFTEFKTHQFMSHDIGAYGDNNDKNRPLVFTKDYEFLSFPKFRILRNCSYKNLSFMGATFQGGTFISCVFSYCCFVGTNLCNVVFHKCTFRGDSTLFFKATTNSTTRFVQCTIEKVVTWKHAADVKKELQKRGLIGAYTSK